MPNKSDIPWTQDMIIKWKEKRNTGYSKKVVLNIKNI